MAKRKNNNFLKLGDVIEIKVDGKLAYAQFVNDEVKDNGAFVNVFSGLYTGRPCLESILSSEAKFQIFLHVIYEFEHTDHLLVIGNAPVSEKFQKLPSMFKTYNDWETGREWFLEYLDGKEFSAEEYFGSHAKNLKKLGAILPKEFHNLPTSGMIYYDELVTRILAKGTNSYDAENGPMQRSPLEDDASDTHIKKDVANENKPIYPGINPITKLL